MCCDVGEATEVLKMNCDVGEVTERLENEQISFPNLSITSSTSQLILHPFRRGRWIFSERKNPEYDFLRKESKTVGPVS